MSAIRNRFPPSLSLAGNPLLIGPSPRFITHWVRSAPAPPRSWGPWFSVLQSTKKPPIKGGFVLVGLVGLEPMTPTMSTWCSNQLSYNPKRGTKRIIAYAWNKCKPYFSKKYKKGKRFVDLIGGGRKMSENEAKRRTGMKKA